MPPQCHYHIEVDVEQILRDKATFISERTGVDAETQQKVWDADHEFWMTRPHGIVVAFEAQQEEEMHG